MVFELNNIEQNAIILKTLIFSILTYYTNFKLLNKKIKFDLKSNILLVIVSIICVIIKYKINYTVSIITQTIMIGLIFSIINVGNNMLSTIISLSINYIIQVISIVVSFFVYKIIPINYNDYIKLIVMTSSHVILLYSLFKIKKFKYGIAFLQKDTNIEYRELLVLNISVLVLFSVIVMSNSNNPMASVMAIEIFIAAIIMFITIKKSLNLYYKQKLLENEVKETKEELEKKKREIQELEAENLSFSKKSHSLIHKQKSLEYKIQQMMNGTEISEEQSAEVRERLNKIGEEIYKEKEKIELDKTGIENIDDMLKYMEAECSKNQIEFNLQIKGNIHHMTNNVVSKEDLEILLADHIKNAIIAIKHTDNINRSIMVKIGDINSVYGINIYDSGIEFELETLKKLGKTPSTTHAEEGGTGMGFMNTFETLAKYKASLTIEEYNKPNKDNYTKMISIKFDNKNEFEIKSYRQNEIKK